MSAQQADFQQLAEKDRILFNLSDTLDMKASVSLVVITFLATQTAVFISNEFMSDVLRWLQSTSAVFLAFAGALAMVVLWPREYSVEKSEEFAGWRARLENYYKGQDDAQRKVDDEYLAGRIQGLRVQIAENRRLDDRKSLALAWSYRLVGVSLGLNMLTLVWFGLN